MISHVYAAKFVEVGPNLELEVDLGFGVSLRKSFKLLGVNTTEGASKFIHNRLVGADEIFVQSMKRVDSYLADVTYRRGDTWYNLAVSLVDNEFAAYSRD